MIRHQTRFNDMGEVGGGTLSLDGKTLDVIGLETSILLNQGYEWTWLDMNLTICDVNGCSLMKLFYLLGMKSGSVSLVTNS